MPVVQTTAYGTVEGALNLARALVNDMIVSTAGEILTDTAPFTFPLLNDAADYVQKELMNHGMNTFVKETLLASVLPIAVSPPDPGSQVNISDSGYFDGVSNHAAPVVPFDLIVPQFLWERQTGTQENWLPMQQVLDGLPSQVQTARIGIWEWRTDAIYMPGATQSEDIRLRYESETLSFQTTSDVILIRGINPAFANRLAYKFLLSRGSPIAATFKEEADECITQLATAYSREKQRVPAVRRRYGNPSVTVGWRN